MEVRESGLDFPKSKSIFNVTFNTQQLNPHSHPSASAPPVFLPSSSLYRSPFLVVISFAPPHPITPPLSSYHPSPHHSSQYIKYPQCHSTAEEKNGSRGLHQKRCWMFGIRSTQGWSARRVVEAQGVFDRLYLWDNQGEGSAWGVDSAR